MCMVIHDLFHHYLFYNGHLWEHHGATNVVYTVQLVLRNTLSKTFKYLKDTCYR
jgi:hypothetical protein